MNKFNKIVLLLAFVMIMFAISCDFIYHSNYNASVVNESSDSLFIKFSSQENINKEELLKPLSSGEKQTKLSVFSFVLEGNHERLNDNEFKNRIESLDIYKIVEGDTMIVNPDKDYFRDIERWWLVESFDDEINSYSYYLIVE